MKTAVKLGKVVYVNGSHLNTRPRDCKRGDRDLLT